MKLKRLLKAKKRPSRASSPVRVVVGLRNPGPDYEGTRHNVGYEVVARVVERHGGRFSRSPGRTRGQSAQIGVGSERILFFVPNSFMNESGGPVRAALDYFGVGPENLLVIHDDIDLPFGRLRLQVGGGSGGHNGIRSVEKALGEKGFSRLKFGVGRPPGSLDPADFVLQRFSRAERKEVDVMVDEAGEIVELWPHDPARAQEQAALRGRGA